MAKQFAVLSLVLVTALAVSRSKPDARVLTLVEASDVRGGVCYTNDYSSCPPGELSCPVYGEGNPPGNCSAANGRKCTKVSYKTPDQWIGWGICNPGNEGLEDCPNYGNIWCYRIVKCRKTCIIVGGNWQCENGDNGALDPGSIHQDRGVDGEYCNEQST